ncbi:hypothetical protein ONE63_007536 [Megalurothrips usitatus]|uniref:Deltamethrin resistance protein prag01 domain-containing protein n=1 Tax=Megalurothrips usitatus TaxID=439358 RepID=A0AAV7XN19_9NEOP|nr:hypothetical protein ONE63_007536 [Megalurothrips usitatus]
MSSIETFEKPSYDVLPVPKGSWQEQYNQKNAYANKVLVVGILSCGGVLAHSLQDDKRPVLKSDLPIDPRNC